MPCARERKPRTIRQLRPMDDEQIIWEGSSSQWLHFPVYLICGLFSVLVVPLIYGIARWIQNRCRRYTITTQRIRIASGVFTRKTDEVELYRVTDYKLVEPFWQRMFGLGNIVLSTSDESNPTVSLEGIRNAAALRDELRKHVETCRDRKRVRISELE
jgi:uncharacterized membrane protein YdbT with pleckstrin-like domain